MIPRPSAILGAPHHSRPLYKILHRLPLREPTGFFVSLWPGFGTTTHPSLRNSSPRLGNTHWPKGKPNRDRAIDLDRLVFRGRAAPPAFT